MDAMRNLALIVPRRNGERVRRQLSEGGWLRTDLKIRADPHTVAFPLTTLPPEPFSEGEMREEEFEPIASPGPRSYRELLGLPEEESARLPRAFDVVGDIVLIRLPKDLEPRGRAIGEALLRFVPGARLVGLDRGVRGTERRRSLERLAGEGPWTTRHAENGLTLDVDVERAYFSPRLAREHARVALQVRAGECVFDLCCGVGPFSLTMARDGRARRLVAVDFNPVAIALGRSSAGRLHLAGRIEFVEASVEAFVTHSGHADRVILNLPREGIKYLSQVGTVVERRGFFHYYEVGDLEAIPGRPNELVALLEREGSGSWTVAGAHRVHPYSPSQDLMAYTLQRES